MLNSVLIVEDDVVLLASIVQALELENLHPIPTTKFVQAKRSIRVNFKGVILSDIKMPDHTGFDILSFTQDKDPDLPIILMTGHSDVPTAIRAIKHGAYDYIEKPFDTGRLLSTLRRALDHRQLVMENRLMRKKLEPREESQGSYTEQMQAYEKKLIEQALDIEKGKVVQAAQRLNLPRNTLYDRMTKLRLVAKAFRQR